MEFCVCVFDIEGCSLLRNRSPADICLSRSDRVSALVPDLRQLHTYTPSVITVRCYLLNTLRIKMLPTELRK